MKNEKRFYGLVIIILAIALIFQYIPSNRPISMDHMHEKFNTLKDSFHEEMLSQGKYRCCLEKPCNTCLALTPWHGEGPECDCLEDVINGEAPCGECVGGILAGRGNPYLAEYFPASIAEGVGEQHLDALKQIIAEKYDRYSYK